MLANLSPQHAADIIAWANEIQEGECLTPVPLQDASIADCSGSSEDFHKWGFSHYRGLRESPRMSRSLAGGVVWWHRERVEPWCETWTHQRTGTENVLMLRFISHQGVMRLDSALYSARKLFRCAHPWWTPTPLRAIHLEGQHNDAAHVLST